MSFLYVVGGDEKRKKEKAKEREKRPNKHHRLADVALLLFLVTKVRGRRSGRLYYDLLSDTLYDGLFSR